MTEIRGYSDIDSIRNYLTSINVDAVSSDEEIQSLIYDATEMIEEETRRRFDTVIITADRYEDPGMGKLVLRNWPIIGVSKIRFYDHSNSLVKEWLSTDADWTQKVIIDFQNGFLEIPALRAPLISAIEVFTWAASRGPAFDRPRLPEFRRIGYATAWIEVDYSYGFTTPPRPISDACTKLVAIELLRKKGAGDTQGASSMSIAGFGETWAQGSPQFTGPFGAMIGSLLADALRTLQLYRKRRSIAVSIL